MTEKEQHMIFQSDTCMVNDNMICWIKERKHRRSHFMGKAENGEIREVTANIWEDRKHHLWFPLSFTKYTVGNGRLYVNSGFLSSREDECLLYRITDITLYRSLPQRIFGTGTIELHTKDRSTPVIRLENIAKSAEVKRVLSDLIEREREEKHVVGRDMYGAISHIDPVEFDGDGDMDDHNFN